MEKVDGRRKRVTIGQVFTSCRNKAVKRTVVGIEPGDIWPYIKWLSTDGKQGICREDFFTRWART